MKFNLSSTLCVGVSLAVCPLIANSQILFSDNFDSTPSTTVTASGLSGSYNVTMQSTDNRVIFGYDYSVANLGIPSAPHSTGGTQIGARFDANRTLGVISALAISPTTTFAGDFILRFDMW